MSDSPLVITILMLSANPKETARLRLDEERRDIEEGLERSQRRDQFRLVKKDAVRPRDIQRAMLDLNPRFVHFSGHGEGEKGIAFEDEAGKTKLVGAEALAGLFKLFADSVECVILNACYSEVQAEAIARHIPYVIGMSEAISDQAAIEFSVGFYDALGAGREIDFAYALGCQAIQLAGIPEHLTPVLKKSGSIPTPLPPANLPVPPSSPHPPRDDSSKRSVEQHKVPVHNRLWFKRSVAAGVAIVSLAGAIVLGGASGIFQKLGSSDEGACFRQAAKEKKLVVAIAQMQSENLASDRKLSSLQSQVFEYLSPRKTGLVEICTLSKYVDNEVAATELGKEIKASIIIWGRRNESFSEIKVTTLKIPVRYFTSISVSFSDVQDPEKLKDILMSINIMTAFALSEIYQWSERHSTEARQILSNAINFAENSQPNLTQKTTIETISQAYYYLGILYISPKRDCQKKLQDCKQAVDSFGRASRIDSSLYQAFLQQGLLLEEMNKLNEAIDAYNQLIKASPIEDTHHWYGLSRRGRVELLNGQTEEAQTTFREVSKFLRQNQEDKDNLIKELRSLAHERPPLNSAIQSILLIISTQG